MTVTKADVRALAERKDWQIVRRCPLCGNERWRPVLRGRQECLLAECDACRFVFLNPRPHRGADDSGYDADHVDLLLPRLVANGLLDENHRPSTDRIRRRYDKLCELTALADPDGVVADIGCGIGISSIALNAAGFETLGLELDESFAAAARSFFGLDVAVADVTQPQERRFAVATLNSVIEHIDEPVSFLRALRENTLEPGGALVVTAPNLASLEFVRDGAEWGMIQPRHVGYFTDATLRQAAELAGFAVANTWCPDVPPRPRDHRELWARSAIGHDGNVSGGIGAVLRAP